MAIKFQEPTKHGKLQFMANIPLAFEDDGAEAYFVAAFNAQRTDEAPVYTYAAGEVDVDPGTVQNGTGLLVQDIVQPAVTAAAQGS